MATEELDFDHRVFDSSSRKVDENLAVRFFTMPIRNETKSAAEGRPIYDDTDMVEIMVRGDRNNIVHKPVDAIIRQRFPIAYRAYREGRELEQSGTPLREWPIVSASMVEELKYFGFHTVEQLAAASDSVIGRFAGLTQIRERAKAFLAYAKDAAPLEQLQTQLDQERSAREAAEANVADMGRRLAALEAQMKSPVPAPAPAPVAAAPVAAAAPKKV